jgi:hypothetical protein
MNALGANTHPIVDEFGDSISEASGGGNFGADENLLFKSKDDLSGNPYACTLLWNICEVRECNVSSDGTIGTSIIQWNSENSIELNVSTGTFKLVTVEIKDKDWQFILCNNTESLNDYGKPTMPYKKLLIPLIDTEVLEVKVEEEYVKDFFEVGILPGFKPLPIGSSYLNGLDARSYFEKHFHSDLSIYQSDRPFPSNTVAYETVILGNNRFLSLTVFPFKFYPTRSQIRVFDVHVEIRLSSSTFVGRQFSSSLPQQENSGYVIVTPSAFSGAVQSFATWKEQLGFSVQITTLEYIYSNFLGRDKPEKLREFIKASYYANGSKYYLLVGDCDVCPAREVWDPAPGPGLDNGTEPCDLYFECLDGSWDANGNSLFGEMGDDVDFYPEVKVGRLPVNTAQEAARVCGMIRKIEENPELGNWIKKFLLIAKTAFTYGDCAAALEEEIDQKFLSGSFFDVTRLYDVDGSLSTSAVVSAMNQGVGLVDFFDHGAYDTWVGALQTSDVLNLQNGNKMFLAFAMACETAAFDYQQYTTISEAFFRNPNGGAIAYIGATRVAWAGYDCFDGLHDRFWRIFLTQAIADMEANPKDALQSALVEMASTYDMSGPSRETIFQAIYFGDPSLNLCWKHNITTTVIPSLETNEACTIHGACKLQHSGIPISSQYETKVRDPTGNLIDQQSGILGVQGDYTMNFSTSAIPGNYTIETSVVNPFNYTHISRFSVGTLNIAVELSSPPCYGTLLEVSGSVLDSGVPVPGQANISIINSGVIVKSKIVEVNTSGQYETQVNITTFGNQELHVWVSSLDDTKHGGTSTAFKVKRGDVLILADDSGEMGSLYPGGWYDLNRGSSTSYYYFCAALENEYNTSIYRILFDPVPDLNFLHQYSAVVLTCGDHFGACLTSMYRPLTEVLTKYHNSGGNLLFEGGDLACSLAQRGYTTFMQSVLHANIVSDLSNPGLYLNNSVSHPVTQGMSSTIPLEGGLGSPSVDLVVPVNGSEMVSGYDGQDGSSIIAFSGESGLGSMVYFAFSIDGIADAYQRELLIRNSIAFIIFPTLKARLSDYALQVNTSEMIWVRVSDANTGQVIKNATVTFMSCGISAQNTTDESGECSISTAPTSAGIINVTVQKTGYLDFAAQIVVYSVPKFAVKIIPEHLRKATQTVDISVTDYYEGNPVAGVEITLAGCDVSEAGYTNVSGNIQFAVTPARYGNIQLIASKTGYEDYTMLIDVCIKAVVVDSFGTDYPEYSWWDDLNYLWKNYGTTPVIVDIKSLDKYGITYEDLVDSAADVLIISCAAASSRQYADDEISAIKRYTLEGHGLIATAGTLNTGVPNNSKLAPLFGMREDIVYAATWFSSLNILDPTHPLFANIPSPYFVAMGQTSCPQDYSWDPQDISEGTYVALSSLRESAIVVHKGLVFVGHWVDYFSNNYDLQLMYNAITWSKYYLPPHDLSVSLEAPSMLEVGNSVLLNATVHNVGLLNETNVELRLLINGSMADYVIVPELEVGSSHILTYLWTPLLENKYNVTAYVVPVLGENMMENNMKSAIVSVIVLPEILIVADDDGSSLIRGTSLPEFESALKDANYQYFVWNESSKGRPPLNFLVKFSLVVWTCGDRWGWAVDPIDATTLEAYLAHGGNIVLEGEDIGFDHHDDGFMVNVAHAIYLVDRTGAPGLTVTNPTHPVTRNLPTTIIWETYPPYDDGVSPTNGGFEVIRYTGTNFTAVTVFEGNSPGKVVYYAFPLYCLEESIRNTLVINSIANRDVAVVDVAVSPTMVTRGEIVLIEVAVENQGTMVETFDVTVYCNDITIETSTVANLALHASTNLSFFWDTSGVAETVYQIKAVASTVPQESDIEDNVFIDGTVTVYPPLDVYTQRGGRGKGVWSDAFAPQEEVIISALMTYKGEPLENKLVGFEVHDPTGYVWDFRSNSTDENGIATVSFRIPSNPVFGAWSVFATGDIAGQAFNDTVPFKVGWLIEIIQIETVDMYGNSKSSFVRGEHLSFNVTVQNIAFTSKEATITIAVYDECVVPIGLVVLQNWVVGSGSTETFIIDLEIPEWAYVGMGIVHANAYTNALQEGGAPYCPETSAIFRITAF